MIQLLVPSIMNFQACYSPTMLFGVSSKKVFSYFESHQTFNMLTEDERFTH